MAVLKTTFGNEPGGRYTRIPAPLDNGKHHESCITSLKYFLDAHKNDADGQLVVSSERYACGYPIPSWQRELKWSREQEVAFIESAWMGLPLGTYTIHTCESEGVALSEFAGLIIDGQQRLTTIERYLNDVFPVYGLLWSELNRVERIRFEGTKFAHYETDLNDEGKIRDLYNRLAFGGTEHTAEERA